MNRRKIYILIIILLTCAICSLLIYDNRALISEYIIKIYNMTIDKNVIVPDYKLNNRNYKYETFSETDDFVPNNIDEIINIYYTVLNNGWEDFTFYCPEEYVECASDVRLVGDNSNYLSLINNYVSPYNTFSKYNTLIINKNEIHVTIDKLYSEEEISASNNEVDKILEKLQINTSSPTLSDVKKIHDHLLKIITYDEEYDLNDKNLITNSNKINGALMDHKAICSGYTDTFAIFMDRLNIPNFKVSSETHVWNVIYFDGKWSHVDVTWDDDEVNENNSHNFFMIDTEKLFDRDTTEHTFEEKLYLELN